MVHIDCLCRGREGRGGYHVWMDGWMDGKGEEKIFFSLSSRFILTASFAPIKRCLEIFYIIAERKRQGAVSLYLAWSVSSSPCQAEVAKHSARAAVRRNRYMYRYRGRYRGPWRTERRQTGRDFSDLDCSLLLERHARFPSRVGTYLRTGGGWLVDGID